MLLYIYANVWLRGSNSMDRRLHSTTLNDNWKQVFGSHTFHEIQLARNYVKLLKQPVSQCLGFFLHFTHNRKYYYFFEHTECCSDFRVKIVLD
jgi:hypothetical protein